MDTHLPGDNSFPDDFPDDQGTGGHEASAGDDVPDGFGGHDDLGSPGDFGPPDALSDPGGAGDPPDADGGLPGQPTGVAPDDDGPGRAADDGADDIADDIADDGADPGSATTLNLDDVPDLRTDGDGGAPDAADVHPDADGLDAAGSIGDQGPDDQEIGTADDDHPSAGGHQPGGDDERAEPSGEVTDLTAAFGADPDLAAEPDFGPTDGADPADGWLSLPDLADVDVPEPAGGRPWIDSALLGVPDGDTDPGSLAADRGDGQVGADELAADLRSSLGEPADPAAEPAGDAYATLAGSDDPAVRALAALWGPTT